MMDWTTLLLPSATAFGYALLHSAWIGALLYALVRALFPLLGGPAARHNLAYGALLALGAGFAYAFYRNFDASPVCENLLAVPLDLATLALGGNPTAAPQRSWYEALTAALPALAPWLSAGYLTGLLPALFLLLRDQHQSRVLRTRALSELPTRWTKDFAALLAGHPATRRVRAHLSARAGEVMTLGFWSPVIVFPVALAGNLTPDMARTILLHEIAHLRAYDHWLNYPQQILRTFFFYHPAAHALCRLIDREREHRCDDWVAARCADRRTYATALVTVARYSLYPQNSLAMSATKTPFSSRVERLFRGEEQRRGHFAFSLAFICLLGAGHLSFTTLGADAGAVDCLEERGLPDGSSGPDINPVVLDASGHAVNVPQEDVVARLTERELAVAHAPALPTVLADEVTVSRREAVVISAIEAAERPVFVPVSRSLPSVSVTRDTTPPAAAKAKIRLRGAGQTDEPIIVIDGRVIPAGTINDVDPNNIESVTVLKGASAMAAYGAEGVRRGVVEILLKEGFSYPSANQVIHGELLAPGNLVDQNEEYLPQDVAKTGYVINGKKVRYAKIKALRAEQIREIRVSSTAEAVRKAGFPGKEQVVIVTTY